MDDIFNWCREGQTLQVRIWLDDPKNDLNQGDDHGFSALHWACFAGRVNIVDMLLNRGARINATNMGDDTALHLAASHGHIDCLKLLLKNKADVNAMNEHGNTPLHYAAFWGHRQCAQMLLEAGAQANLANVEGDTPLDKCHKSLLDHLHHLAGSVYHQDLSKRVSYRDASQMRRQQELRTRDAKLSRQPELKLSELSLQTRASTTHSGETWRGTWNGVEICAKFINYGPECRQRLVRDFTDEFPRLRIFSHPNVLPVIGCVIEPPSLVLVNQYLSLGSLYSLLHERKQLVVDGQQAIRFALDVARGMAFLHSLDPTLERFHLNSLHVLIDDDLTARLNMADTKFSFQERNKLYQPAWVAPEALQRPSHEINQRAADMWSFGVLLWELATRQIPFGGMSPIEIGVKVALEDMRLSMAGNIQHQVAKLIRICMNEEPGKRPSFDQVVPILTKMAHK